RPSRRRRRGWRAVKACGGASGLSAEEHKRQLNGATFLSTLSLPAHKQTPIARTLHTSALSIAQIVPTPTSAESTSNGPHPCLSWHWTRMSPHALSQARRQRFAVIPCVLVALYLFLAGSPPPARAEAYPHLSARTVARDRAAARAHAAALNRRVRTRPPAPLRGNPARSLLSLQAMQRFFYIQGTGLYREEPYSTPYAFLFPFSQALAATVSASYIPRQAKNLAGELRLQLHGLQKYFKTSSVGAPGSSPESTLARRASYSAAESGGTSYYDDNEWVGIELMRIYKLNHNRAALAQAEQIMGFVMAGWQANT